LRQLDTGRQWVDGLGRVSDHHRIRYEFAAANSSGRILDAACGCGYGSGILSIVGEVTGVDFDPEAIEWAKKTFPGPEYICGDITTSPWRGKFDTVVSFETIEHVEDASKILEPLRHACCGTFIGSVPNEVNYPFKAENFANDKSPHFRHYTPEEFEHLLIKYGFSIRERFCQRSKNKPDIVKGTDGIFLVYVCD
jgi:2-polyprenyl-3-methyl-5-hydroxy-6-metoxy-1,4-benzoquinol methylase